MTDQEKIDVIQAKIDGKEIEASFISEDVYNVNINPKFNFQACKYRVKKKPKLRDLTSEELRELLIANPWLKVKVSGSDWPNTIMRYDFVAMRLCILGGWERVANLKYTLDYGKSWRKFKTEAC